MQDFENGVDAGWQSQRARWGGCVTSPLSRLGQLTEQVAHQLGHTAEQVPPAGEEAKGLPRPGPAWAMAQRCDGLGTRLWKVLR